MHSPHIVTSNRNCAKLPGNRLQSEDTAPRVLEELFLFFHSTPLSQCHINAQPPVAMHLDSANVASKGLSSSNTSSHTCSHQSCAVNVYGLWTLKNEGAAAAKI